jgi:hypothetical protein
MNELKEKQSKPHPFSDRRRLPKKKKKTDWNRTGVHFWLWPVASWWRAVGRSAGIARHRQRRRLWLGVIQNYAIQGMQQHSTMPYCRVRSVWRASVGPPSPTTLHNATRRGINANDAWPLPPRPGRRVSFVPAVQCSAWEGKQGGMRWRRSYSYFFLSFLVCGGEEEETEGDFVCVCVFKTKRRRRWWRRLGGSSLAPTVRTCFYSLSSSIDSTQPKFLSSLFFFNI